MELYSRNMCDVVLSGLFVSIIVGMSAALLDVPTPASCRIFTYSITPTNKEPVQSLTSGDNCFQYLILDFFYQVTALTSTRYMGTGTSSQRLS